MKKPTLKDCENCVHYEKKSFWCYELQTKMTKYKFWCSLWEKKKKKC